VFETTILLTVTFLNNELVLITESSITSLVCQTCDPVIVVLNRFVPFSIDPVDAESVSMLWLNIVDVVTSEFCSIESLMFDVVEFEFVRFELYIFEFVSIIEFVRFELYIFEFVSIIEFVRFELFVIEFWNSEFDVITYFSVEF